MKINPAFVRGFFVLYKVQTMRYAPCMALTPEKKVKNKVVRLLKEHGAYYFFPASYGMGRSGVPDVVCCLHGCFIGIECKAGKNKPTPLQEKELADITKAGGVSCVINENNMDTLTTILTTAMSLDTDELISNRLRDLLR